MAKEYASSRIRRLDGVSRIPLPGSLRPMANSAIATKGRSTTQKFRSTSTGFGNQRPVSLTSNIKSLGATNLLKRSSSGDHITNAMSMVSKKTSATINKFINKQPENASTRVKGITQQEATDKQVVKEKVSMVTAGTPRPLTRSDTFVRSNSHLEGFDIKRNALAQSTPAPALLMKGAVCDITQTLSGGDTNKCNILHTTQSLDNTLTALSSHALENTQTFVKGYGKNFDTCSANVAKPAISKTICVDDTMIEKPLSVTQTLNPQNLTKTFNATQIFGKTMCVISPSIETNAHLGNILMPDNTENITLGSSPKKLCILGSISPATNATFSNNGSMENLQMLEDVSIPSGFDVDISSQNDLDATITASKTTTMTTDDTLLALTPNKANMKLPLNSTMNTERLVDISTNLISPATHMQLLNATRSKNAQNSTQLLYMTQISNSASTTPDRIKKFGRHSNGDYHNMGMPEHMTSPMLLKSAQSDLVLPIRTSDDEESMLGQPMDIDVNILSSVGARTEEFITHCQRNHQQSTGVAMSLQDVNSPNSKQKTRFSFGFDLTESTLDCSIELVDASLSSTAISQHNANSMRSNSNISQSPTAQQQYFLKKQNSFDLDESLGILTPDQMKDFLDSNHTNTNNLDLPLALNANSTTNNNNNNNNNNSNNKMALHQMRIDQTPSPEELPFDPVEVKTNVAADEMQMQQHQHQMSFCVAHERQQVQQEQQQQQQQYLNSSSMYTEPVSVHSDTDISKTDQMIKSNVSKISTSFITSVTSVTSLDTGYQGDGEMSRPASRGPGDHSPSNGPIARKGGHVSRQPSFNQQQLPPIRRQDPMTDSDFFTESDADDIFHRGDRRAQVIDGQLYGPTLQPSTSVFISEDPQMEDSCMESSGIFTDVENRCEEDPAQMRRQETQDGLDMSPDADDSTETVKSNRGGGGDGGADKKRYICASTEQENEINLTNGLDGPAATQQSLGQGLSCSQISSTIQSSYSTDRLSAATTLSNRTSYCSVDGSTINVDCKSFSSLEEAFDEYANSAGETNTTPKQNITRTRSSTTTGNTSYYDQLQQKQQQQQLQHQSQSVQRLNSPRKHSSLTSLCNVNGIYGGCNTNKSETYSPVFNRINVGACVGSCGAQSTSADSKVSSLNESVKSINSSVTRSYSPRTRSNVQNNVTSKNVRSPSTVSIPAGVNRDGVSAQPRKSHSPNKWDAVMNKIASNKALIKKNYNDVKSKVLTTRVTAITAAAAAVTGAGRCCTSPGTVRQRSLSSANNNNGGSMSPNSVVGVTKVFKTSAKTVNSSSSSRNTTSPLNGLQSPQQHRLLQAAVAAKRGRSYSKDSQKSSQSDASLTSGGSPKLLAKTPLRAAKKRDVRNLTISPTDLGPPPKTQQTANGTSAARSKPTQKRFNSNVSSVSATPSATSTTAPSTPSSVNGTSVAVSSGGNVSNAKGSATIIPANAKKQQQHTFNSIITTKQVKLSTSKTPLRDHNRDIGSTQSITTPTTTTTTTTPTTIQNHKNNNKIIATVDEDVSADLHDITSNGLLYQNNNSGSCSSSIGNNNNRINNTTTTTTTSKNSRTSTISLSSSPILGQNGKKLGPTASSTTTTSTTTTVPVEKKSQSKVTSATRKLLFSSSSSKQNHTKARYVDANSTVASNTTTPSTPTSNINVAELQQLKLLNRHSCNGRLNYEALERHLEQAELFKQHQNKGVEALGVLIQYLVYDLDAFGCPAAKNECAKVNENLTKSLHALDEAKNTCAELQEKLCDNLVHYQQREEKLQASQRSESEKAQKNLTELQHVKGQLSELEQKLVTQEIEHKRVFECYRLEMENKLLKKQEAISSAAEHKKTLEERLKALESNNEDLRKQLTTAEQTYTERLQIAADREMDLNERVKVLSKEFENMRATKENSERELRDKLNLSHDEISVLRSTRRSLNENVTRGGLSPRNSTTASANIEMTRLQSETESLRCVLELKQKEISKLSKQNEELMRDAEERVALQAKISLLESRNEMLQSEMDIKSEKEKDFLKQIDEIQKAFNHEIIKRTRLTYDKEALQWHLKQRSEQLHIVEAKLQESLNVTATAQNSSHCSLNRSSVAVSNGNSLGHMEDLSPPASPIVKGVIEKPDSVSWVLEMDDETPEVAASKMVRRAGSFRSVERSPSTRRQLSMSASATCSSSNVTNGSGSNGPNPLSQSMSATSVIRRHSSEAGPEFTNRSHSRIRSKSVSVKSSEPTIMTSMKSGKQLQRQHSVGAGSGSSSRKSELVLPSWKDPIVASSPYNNNLRPRTSTMCSDASSVGAANQDGNEELFRRSSTTRKLITCDTSALNSGERLEMHSLPTHASVQDLKVLKKCQEIQESAGEAMVSGTNSEDEGCSASSDEIASTVSTTSAASSSTSSLNHMKNSHMSFEEVLLLEKINSLNGTPMEVSWSDDAGEAFTTSTTNCSTTA